MAMGWNNSCNSFGGKYNFNGITSKPFETVKSYNCNPPWYPNKVVDFIAPVLLVAIKL